MDFKPLVTYFPDGKSIVSALSAYNKNENKTTKSVVSSGRQRQYRCTDNNCIFRLEFLRKQKSNGIRSSRYGHIPEGFWYVTKFEPHTRSCNSTSTPSAKDLGELPAFVGAVNGTRNQVASETLLKEIVSEAHSIGGLSHAKIQRARVYVKKKFTTKISIHTNTSQLYATKSSSTILDLEFVASLIQKDVFTGCF
jgi:hypothetical protein